MHSCNDPVATLQRMTYPVGVPRYVGVALGVLIALGDVLLANSFGLRFAVGAHDGNVIVFVYLALSFGGLGFLVGELIERRKNERRLEARAVAQERLAALGTFAAAVAHEVRNPLAIIRSTVQNLEEAPETVAHASHVVRDEIDRLTRTITVLLGFAKTPKPELERLSTAAFFARLEAVVGRSIDGKHRLITRPDDNYVMADEALLMQASLALLNNAREAMPDGGAITIAAKAQQENVELSVTDEGPGISEQAAKQLFQPLFTTKDDGHGLGLSVAKRLVEAQGGTIGVRPGKGATFFITLPRVNA
jgi:signal transduction histidine kinase